MQNFASSQASLLDLQCNAHTLLILAEAFTFSVSHSSHHFLCFEQAAKD
jgi:hypothetical protein